MEIEQGSLLCGVDNLLQPVGSGLLPGEAFCSQHTKLKEIVTITEIPFLINMGWSFFITVAVMVGISLAGPKVNPKAFVLDKSMFRLEAKHIVLIVITLMILAALYVRFW